MIAYSKLEANKKHSNGQGTLLRLIKFYMDSIPWSRLMIDDILNRQSCSCCGK